MSDLDVVAVRIEHPCCIIARIVFAPHRLGIGLSFFEPEKSSFAVTKTLQIGVSVLALVICKVCDPKWLQGPGVKSD
jgi:16S rRNA U1498 N3-methylase RsmE